jgi:hypothetical protein
VIAIIAPIYGWITEASTCPDVKEAKAPLERLDAQPTRLTTLATSRRQ